MDTLRKPFFFLAIALIAVCVLVELGVGSLLADVDASATQVNEALSTLPGDAATQNQARAEVGTLSQKARPGLAIRYLALLDGVLLFTVAIMAGSFLLPPSLLSRLQGIVTCIGSCLLILLGIVLIIVALLLLLLMVGLLLAVPFGTITYFAVFGFFDRTGANVTLSLLMLLKIGFVVGLIAANQRFLQNKGLVLIVLTSLIANIVISFLHNLVPRFLVSITDSIAAIIIGILAVIWAIFLLVGALIAIVRGLKVA